MGCSQPTLLPGQLHLLLLHTAEGSLSGLVHLSLALLEQAHGRQLLLSGERQPVDCQLGAVAEQLLAGGIADGAGSVADDVVCVPHMGVHGRGALSNSLWMGGGGVGGGYNSLNMATQTMCSLHVHTRPVC